MSSANMDEIDEIIRQEISAIAEGFGENGNDNNVPNDNNMLNENSVPLEDLGLYDSDYEMTDEYESDDPTSNGPWSLPQPSLSPSDVRRRLLEAEYARYIRDTDDEVWLTQGHFQDESSQSSEESPMNPISPKPTYTDDDDDAKVPEYHMGT